PIPRRAMRAGKEPPAQIPLLGACFVDCGAQPPAGPRQSGALAPHSTTLARSAEYQAESPKFWSAPRQRHFPAAGALQTFAALRETVLVCEPFVVRLRRMIFQQILHSY